MEKDSITQINNDDLIKLYREFSRKKYVEYIK